MIEACCDGVGYDVLCGAGRVVAFEVVMCGDVWDIVFDVW